MNDEKPSSSSLSQPNISDGNALQNEDTDEQFMLKDDEEAEIARLQLPPSDNVDAETMPSKIKKETPDDERIAKIVFHCSSCEMHEMVHYFGKEPPFINGLTFLEDTYVMRDPFQPPPPRWKCIPEYFIAMGSNCVQCARAICKGAECSFFYTCTFCLPCAQKSLKSFPLEAQTKLRKQLTINS